jgi:hypothetical protein
MTLRVLRLRGAPWLLLHVLLLLHLLLLLKVHGRCIERLCLSARKVRKNIAIPNTACYYRWASR